MGDNGSKTSREQNLEKLRKKYPNATIVSSAPKSELEKAPTLMKQQCTHKYQKTKKIHYKEHDDEIYVIANKRSRTCPWCYNHLVNSSLQRQDKSVPIMYCSKCEKFFVTTKMKNKWEKWYGCDKFSSIASISRTVYSGYDKEYITKAKYQSQCSRCHKPVPEGWEYCIECAKEEREKLYES